MQSNRPLYVPWVPLRNASVTHHTCSPGVSGWRHSLLFKVIDIISRCCGLADLSNSILFPARPYYTRPQSIRDDRCCLSVSRWWNSGGSGDGSHVSWSRISSLPSKMTMTSLARCREFYAFPLAGASAPWGSVLSRRSGLAHFPIVIHLPTTPSFATDTVRCWEYVLLLTATRTPSSAGCPSWSLISSQNILMTL